MSTRYCSARRCFRHHALGVRVRPLLRKGPRRDRIARGSPCRPSRRTISDTALRAVADALDEAPLDDRGPFLGERVDRLEVLLERRVKAVRHNCQRLDLGVSLGAPCWLVDEA